MAKRMGTYTGGNSAISKSSAAKADNGVVVRNAMQPVSNDCFRLSLIPAGGLLVDVNSASFKESGGCSSVGDCNIFFPVVVSCCVRGVVNLLSENDVAPWRVRQITTNAERRFSFAMAAIFECCGYPTKRCRGEVE